MSDPVAPGDGASPRADVLLAWYDKHRRNLPWRSAPGATPDPYRVWLSEIMLQQTTVAAVGPYFDAFLKRWPTVRDLAHADTDAVLKAWAGLGYYARAHNLQKCARIVVDLHDGSFPADESMLRRLPGIGPYTAAAIAAIAFGRRATPVDGNVERVMARLFAVETPLPAAKRELHDHAVNLTPNHRWGDYAQAVMDLGATICRPANPACRRCPWEGACAANRQDIASDLPRRTPRPERPIRYGVAFWVTRDDGSVLLRRRPDDGLLGGMMEIPSTEWRSSPWVRDQAVESAPVTADWQVLEGVVRHGFTHFQLELTVLAGRVTARDLPDGTWCPEGRQGDYALPSVMKKIVIHARRLT